MSCGALDYTVAVVELLGVILGAYGVLRESFGDLALGRPFGEGRSGEGSYGGQPTTAYQRWIRLAVTLRLLPPDRSLTITDRRRNATVAILGVAVLVLAMFTDIVIVRPTCIP